MLIASQNPFMMAMVIFYPWTQQRQVQSLKIESKLNQFWTELRMSLGNVVDRQNPENVCTSLSMGVQLGNVRHGMDQCMKLMHFSSVKYVQFIHYLHWYWRQKCCHHKIIKERALSCCLFVCKTPLYIKIAKICPAEPWSLVQMEREDVPPSGSQIDIFRHR